MDVKSYLERIGYNKPVKPDADTLRGLHYAHMLTVPFENLDIHFGKPIQLNETALWNKIIVRKRGGFCYELNGLFAWLLKRVRFEVTYLNGRVYNDNGKYGREFDHLALLVEIPGSSERWLADVGFGDSFVRPLKMIFGKEQAQSLRSYRLEKIEDGIDLWRRNYDGTWTSQYFFDLYPRHFPGDYNASCQYHQSSPNSSFTRDFVISRTTPDGRISLDPNNLTITRKGRQKKRPIKDNDEYQDYLKHRFGIEL